VRAGGGGEAELSSAWALVQAAPVATDLMDLPATATPAEMAVAARDAVAALLGATG
jgi:hypothetical protein